MFKVLVLQTLYTLLYDATEFQIRDRLSFMRSSGLGLRTRFPCKAQKEGTKFKVEIAIPIFRYKTHVLIDRRYGFVRRFAVTITVAHDGAKLANVLDLANTASDVWADTAYRSKANEVHLAKHGGRSKIHFGGRWTTIWRRSKANRARSKIRSTVETVFAAQKHCFGLFVRTIGMARARTKSRLANLAHHLNRFL